MNKYIICTDSSCDLSKDEIKKRGLHMLSLCFRFVDSNVEYSNDAMPISEFYEKMRGGSIAKTSAVNSESFAVYFEEILKTGYDILYIGFSSGLSTTFNSARIAANQLKKAYPHRKIITVDSLAASAGIALLIDLVIEKKNSGANIEEAAKYAEDMKLKICHWFTVDDLVYLKRGGRVSPTTAFVGNMLGIKPILHVDNEGHLICVGKARGRRLSISTLAEKYGELHNEEEKNKVYIAHSDCISDASLLAEALEKQYNVNTKLITNVGPVIGAHSGPGTLALFFVGESR